MKLNINLKYLSVSIIFVVCIMAIVIFYTKNNREQSYSSTMFSMDTIVSVQTYGSDLTSEVQSKVEELNDIFDRHSIDTPLYILNKDKILKNPSIYLNDLVTKTLELNDEFGSNVDISSGILIPIPLEFLPIMKYLQLWQLSVRIIFPSKIVQYRCSTVAL